MHTFDPQIVQDFLTESGELLDQLEADLVELERSPRDPEMLNKAFRALHTIKGSASFLALTNLVRIAHAAESALNAARSGVIVVDRAAMDLLLKTIDVLRTQMRQLGDGEELVEAPKPLVEQLSLLGEGKGANPAPTTPSVADAPAAITPAVGANTLPIPVVASRSKSTKIQLDESKSDLFQYLVSDLDDTMAKVDQQIQAIVAGADIASAGVALTEAAAAIHTSVDFFGFDPISRLAEALGSAGKALGSLAKDRLAQALPRVQGVASLLAEQVDALRAGELSEQHTEVLLSRLHDALSGGKLAGDAVLPDPADAEVALRIDGVREEASAGIPGTHEAPHGPGAAGDPNEASKHAPAVLAPASPPSAVTHPPNSEDAASGKKTHAESTIRVEVGRLEALMNLVGELVLEKNRIGAIARKLTQAIGSSHHELSEQATLAAGGLDRISADIQTAVMRTRLQPLEKLFGKYPRLIRDLSGKTGKKINLVIEGGETEVDKSVIEELGDPLVHLLRNAADHGLETPEQRAASGKLETGTITLRASHQGSHVNLSISDDGRGLPRERIAKKAVERGLVEAEAVSALSDSEVFQFIFEPGFSTAEQVSDLSGRGVGMDVVRTNIARIKGSIELASEPGLGTTVSITIPLTLAILPAMMVEVKGEVYAIPLGHVVEIVKPRPDQLSTIGQMPVLRLRDAVLPLVSAADAFGIPIDEGEDLPFAVILDMNQKRAGLRVGSLIGQHDIVIKPLDGVGRERAGAKSPVSGATVRDDGGVSLIVDVASLLRKVEDVKLALAKAEKNSGRD